MTVQTRAAERIALGPRAKPVFWGSRPPLCTIDSVPELTPMVALLSSRSRLGSATMGVGGPSLWSFVPACIEGLVQAWQGAVDVDAHVDASFSSSRNTTGILGIWCAPDFNLKHTAWR